MWWQFANCTSVPIKLAITPRHIYMLKENSQFVGGLQFRHLTVFFPITKKDYKVPNITAIISHFEVVLIHRIHRNGKYAQLKSVNFLLLCENL